MPTHEILTLPSPLVKAVPKEYTEQQQKQIQELREYGQSIMLPETDPYYPNEKKWLIEDEACAERYMRASKWRMDEAKKRIKGTLEWRRDYKPDLIPADEVKVEAETGKIILTGFDRDGRPILYLRPGRENTKESPRQIRHLVFLIERAIDFMPPHVESMMCLVDYRSATLKTSPSISNARHFLGIVQNHYVERLGRAIVVNLPFILNFFFKAITPFMDPVTRDKIRFNPNLLDLIPPEQLDATLQKGTYDFEFEHELYWKTICDWAGVKADGTRFVPDRSRGVAEINTSPPSSDHQDEVKAIISGEDTPSTANDNGNGEVVNGNDLVVASSNPTPAAENSPSTPISDGASTTSGTAVEPQSITAPDAVQPTIGVVNVEKLQQMRLNVAAKYEQTHKNLEANLAREAAAKQGEQPEQPPDNTSEAANTIEDVKAPPPSDAPAVENPVGVSAP